MNVYRETRIGNYSGEANTLARRYADDFFPVPTGVDDVHKCAKFIREDTGSYLMMISSCNNQRARYGLMMSVWGLQKQRVSELMRDFEGRIGVETSIPPIELSQELDANQALLEGLFRLRAIKTD